MSNAGYDEHFESLDAQQLRPTGDGPLVAIPAWRFARGRSYALSASLALPSAYSDAITAAGGLALALTPFEIDDASADTLIARVDALVLPGGPDVQPSRYDQSAHPAVYLTSAVQDAFEAALYGAAMRARKPVLAICRGTQLVNVVHGGTLHQHLPDLPNLIAHGIPEGGGAASTTPTIDAGSATAATLGTTTPTGNCHHHQAIDRLGDGLVVVGQTADGIVEAIERTDDRPLRAVQWHPEETALTDPAQLALFRWLVNEASAEGR